MNLFKVIILSIGLTIISSLTAQINTKVWEKDLTKQINEIGWIEQLNEGTILAAGPSGMIGIDNKTGEQKWEIKQAKSVDKTTFNRIDQTTLFTVSYNNLIGGASTLLINSKDGEIWYDSKENNLSIKGHKVDMEHQLIFFEVNKDKQKWIMCYDLITKKERWMSNVGDIKGGIIGRLLARSFIDNGPFYNNQNNVIINIDKDIFCYDINSGKEVWKYTAKKNISALLYFKDNNSLYLGVKKDEKLYVYDANTGSDITPGKLKLRGVLEKLSPYKNNQLIVTESEGFNILDPKTNNFLWSKSYKLENISEVIPHGDNFIVVAATEKETNFHYVDKNSEKIWKNNYTGYSYFNAPTEKGLFFITSEVSNILNFTDGGKIWKKTIKFRGIPAFVFDEKDNKAVFFEREKLYKVDMKSGDIEIVKEGIVLAKGFDKNGLSAEMFGDNYLISDNQHISLLSKSGDLIYSKFYNPTFGYKGFAAIGEGIAKNALGVDLDIEGSMKSFNDMKKLAKGSVSFNGSNAATQGTEKSKVVMGMYTGKSPETMTTVFEITEHSFFNTQSDENHQYIVTSDELNGTKGNKIILVNKKTGNIDKFVKIDDKTPTYIIDNVDGLIFVAENNTFLRAYSK